MLASDGRSIVVHDAKVVLLLLLFLLFLHTYIYTYINIHIYIYICTHTYVHISLFTNMLTSVKEGLARQMLAVMAAGGPPLEAVANLAYPERVRRMRRFAGLRRSDMQSVSD